MRRHLKAIIFLAFGPVLMPTSAPEATAADLAVTRGKQASVRVIHRHRTRVVRDYDGTAIVLRPARPMVMRDFDGTIRAVRPLSNAYPVIASPGTYLNGEPVLPITRPRLSLLRRY